MPPTSRQIIVCGNAAVGKSAVVIKFLQGYFIQEYDPTIEDTYRKCYSLDGRKYTLEILDTSGAVHFTEITNYYLERGDGYILVFSVTSRNSFDGLGEIYERILERQTLDKIPLLLIGNKIDLELEREVPFQDGKELAEAMNCSYLEVSAKESINVDFTFECMVKEIDLVKPLTKKKNKFNIFKRGK